MVAPILFEDENGPYYGPAEKFADRARMHTISSLSKSTPLCSFREMTNEEAVFKYGALFLRLGETVERIKNDFGHDAFILIRDANALMKRFYEKTPCCGRKVHYGEIDAEFQKYIDKVGYSQAAMFQKSLEYAWQQEFRIIIAPQEDKDRVFIEVGSIEDIAIGGDIEVLRNGFFIGRDDSHVNEVLHTLKENQITLDDIFNAEANR